MSNYVLFFGLTVVNIYVSTLRVDDMGRRLYGVWFSVLTAVLLGLFVALVMNVSPIGSALFALINYCTSEISIRRLSTVRSNEAKRRELREQRTQALRGREADRYFYPFHDTGDIYYAYRERPKRHR